MGNDEEIWEYDAKSRYRLQSENLLISVNDLFGSADAQEIGPSLFDHNPQLLAAAAKGLTGRSIDLNQIERMRGGLLAVGLKYSTLIYGITVNGEEYYFVANLPRNLRERSQLEEDCQYLGIINQNLKGIRRESIRNKYRVPQIFGMGSASHADREIPFYLASYLPFPRILVHDSPGLPGARFSYQARMLAEKFAREYEPAINYERHLTDLAIAMFVIHKASGGFYAKEPDIEAGDWVGIIGKNGMEVLGLTTLRGGVEKLNQNEMIQKMVDFHVESSRAHFEFHPFKDISRRSLKALSAIADSYFS